MAQLDPEHVNIFIENIGKLFGGIAIAFIGLQKWIGYKRDNADQARKILKDEPVTTAEVDLKLLQCKMQINDSIATAFSEFRHELSGFRHELMDEIKDLHKRINEEDRRKQ